MFYALSLHPNIQIRLYNPANLLLPWKSQGGADICRKEPLVFVQMAELMKEAQDRVIFHSPYAVLNEDMVEVLKKVAENVPETELMINSFGNGDNIFASSDYGI